MRPRVLLPGPTELEDEVLEALGRQVVPHYGDEWVATYNCVLDDLRQVFLTAHEMLLLVGTGTAGLEGALGSMVAPGERVVVVDNGHFGARLVTMARALGLEVVTVAAPGGRAVAPEDVGAVLQAQRCEAVCVVHNETSTGVVNPLRELAQVAHQHGAALVVDAVSSVGGVELRVDEWQIEACCGAVQKCLGAPPGLAPVALLPNAIETMRRKRDIGHRGFYLQLLTWLDYARDWADWHPFPVTMACSLVLALQAALRPLLAEGMEARWSSLRDAARRLRQALRALGCGILADEAVASPVTTTVVLPQALDAVELLAWLRTERRLWVAGGLGEQKGRSIRLGHFCRGASDDYLRLLLIALEDFFATHGVPVERGAALAAFE